MNYNAIEENFKIKKMFSEMFKSSADTSPISIKKHYPEIYAKVMLKEINRCSMWFKQNIQKIIY
jgi:hypothetical protein